MEGAPRDVLIDIEGMTCASCVVRLERVLGAQQDVESARVNLATGIATVRTGLGDLSTLIESIQRAGYGARPHRESIGEGSAPSEFRAWLPRLSIATRPMLPVGLLTSSTNRPPTMLGGSVHISQCCKI